MTHEDLPKEYSPNGSHKTIGEMTDEEILEYYRNSENGINKAFVELWMKLHNFKEKYPEYYL